MVSPLFHSYGRRTTDRIVFSSFLAFTHTNPSQWIGLTLSSKLPCSARGWRDIRLSLCVHVRGSDRGSWYMFCSHRPARTTHQPISTDRTDLVVGLGNIVFVCLSAVRGSGRNPLNNDEYTVFCSHAPTVWPAIMRKIHCAILARTWLSSLARAWALRSRDWADGALRGISASLCPLNVR